MLDLRLELPAAKHHDDPAPAVAEDMRDGDNLREPGPLV
jgi:hypothetical protein